MSLAEPIEAVVDAQGNLRPIEPVKLKPGQRAWVTLIDPTNENQEKLHLLAEASLAKDWNRPEEDEAWQYLQQEQ